MTFPQPLSEDARDLILKMLKIKPLDRISIPEILTHKWLKGADVSDGLEGTEDEDDHDFRLGISF